MSGEAAAAVLPLAMTLVAVALTLSTYDQHLKTEPCTPETARFVRRLGFVNMLITNLVVTVLILLSLEATPGAVLAAVTAGTTGSGILASLQIAPPNRADGPSPDGCEAS